jgi:hypothetical protein
MRETTMPQLFMLALIGTLGVLAAKTFGNTRERVTVRLREAERTMAEQPLGTLVRDPVTGVYRPSER